MGTYTNGANGAFSGKAGSIIGSSWRDINYIKGLPKKSTKPASQKQLEQQAKFALAIQFLLPIKRQVNIGFGAVKKGKASGYNMAAKYLLDKAIIGDFPNYEIDYPSVMVAKGPLSNSASFALTPGTLEVEISWTSDTNPTTAYPSDLLNVLIHDPVSVEFVTGPPNILRSAQTGTVAIPSDWLGREVHVYLYFISQENGQVSKSTYGGSFTVI